MGSPRTGDELGFEADAGSLTGFELAIEDEGGIGEFFSREAEGGQSFERNETQGI